MFKSWLVAHENWVSVWSFLVPGNCKNAGKIKEIYIAWLCLCKLNPDNFIRTNEQYFTTNTRDKKWQFRDSKSSLIHYTFDKTKFLSQLHICIVLLYLIFYFSKFMFKSWLVAHENWVSVGSFLVPGNCKNAGFFTIYPRVYGVLGGPQTPCRTNAAESRLRFS
jgi:hypothetical protein